MTAEISIEEDIEMGRTSHSDFSFKKGYYYYFKDGEDTIVARCSAWNGMETIYVNDEKVSEFRSLGFNSKHVFEHNGTAYRIMFIIQGLAKGEVECILIKDGEIIGEETNAFYPNRKKRSKWVILGVTLLCFVGGLGAGYAFGKLIKYLVG